MIASIEDIDAIPRRVAYSLTTLFFGLFFSEAIFSPLAKRASTHMTEDEEGDSGWKRAHALGLAGVGLALLTTLSVLFALAQDYNKDNAASNMRIRAVPSKELVISFPSMALSCRREPYDDLRNLPILKEADLSSQKYKPTLRVGDAAYLLLSNGSRLTCVRKETLTKKTSAEKIGIGLAL